VQVHEPYQQKYGKKSRNSGSAPTHQVVKSSVAYIFLFIRVGTHAAILLIYLDAKSD
jgi:hypothetical protein